MARKPVQKTIKRLERILREQKENTEVLAKSLEALMAEQVSPHPLAIAQARVLSAVLDEAMGVNATLFEASRTLTERRMRSELDDAFRAQQAILKKVTQVPLRGG